MTVPSEMKNPFPVFNTNVRNAIKATGSNDSFVVMTLQRGKPPEVRWTGDGLAAVVTAGPQTVRFDGQTIVFGP